MIGICLVSSDPSLAKACRLILNQLIPESFEMHREIRDGAQVYIWDADSTPAMPAAMRKAKGSVKVVIVPKQSQARMRSSLPPEEYAFVQSPWNVLSLAGGPSSIASRACLGRTDAPKRRQK